MNGLNDQSILDTRQLITGKDGQLYVTSRAGVNIFLAEADTFQAQLNVNNVDYQPVGSGWVFKVTTGQSMTIMLTEAVIRDDVMMQEFIDDIRNGYIPNYDFVGKMRRREGQAQRIIYRRCIPDGTVDLQNLTPGDIVKRSWSFGCN